MIEKVVTETIIEVPATPEGIIMFVDRWKDRYPALVLSYSTIRMNNDIQFTLKEKKTS
jgi:hypothetical protein